MNPPLDTARIPVILSVTPADIATGERGRSVVIGDLVSLRMRDSMQKRRANRFARRRRKLQGMT